MSLVAAAAASVAGVGGLSESVVLSVAVGSAGG